LRTASYLYLFIANAWLYLYIKSLTMFGEALEISTFPAKILIPSDRLES